MNNPLSYCGLIDAKKRASVVDLPVNKFFKTCLLTTLIQNPLNLNLDLFLSQLATKK